MQGSDDEQEVDNRYDSDPENSMPCGNDESRSRSQEEQEKVWVKTQIFEEIPALFEKGNFDQAKVALNNQRLVNLLKCTYMKLLQPYRQLLNKIPINNIPSPEVTTNQKPHAARALIYS